MVKLVLECSFPIVLYMLVQIALILLDLRRPAARALGWIISKVCIVSSEEILRYNAQLEQEEESGIHLRREARWKKICVIWGFVRAMMCNTRLIQQTARFEEKKIDPRKSSLKYEQPEILVLELVDDSAQMRWRLYKWQLNLVMRAVLGLNVNQKVLMDLLGQYKQLEEGIIALSEMADDRCYRDMLLDRLGLANWGVINGGGSEPEPA